MMSDTVRLNAWEQWTVARGPHANLGMLYMASYLMFKHRVYWKYLYNKYIFNFIDHLHCYSSEQLCRQGPSALLCREAYNAVKTALRSSDVDEVLFE